MKDYIILLRGINVGGKNKVPMAELKRHLEELGYGQVRSYINSGNILLQADTDAEMLGSTIEKMLTQNFIFDSTLIKVLVLTPTQLEAIIKDKPKGFGDQSSTYHSDAIFLLNGITIDQAMVVFKPKEGVDIIWPGNGVIYSQRLSALRTKSRLSQIMGTPEYKYMTIRNWNTVIQLLSLTIKSTTNNKSANH